MDKSFFLALLTGLGQDVKDGKVQAADVAGVLRKLVHSPIADVLVRLTPNTLDDRVLTVLRSILPA